MKNLRLSFFCLAFLLAASLAVFGAGTQEPSAEAKPGEIVFVGGDWWNDFGQLFKDRVGYDLFGRFEEQTGIKVKVEKFPFRQLFQTIEVRLNAKESNMDVYQVDAPLTASYAVRGFLKPVGDVLSQQEINEFFPACVEMAKWKGELYNLPHMTSSQLMFFNQDLFQKAGIKPPAMDVKQRLTWEEVVEIAKKIVVSQNTPGGPKAVWGLHFEQVSRPYQMLVLPQSLGAGSGVSPDGLHVEGYLNNEGWVKAMQWWYDANNTWEICPKGMLSEQAGEFFSSGKIAMMIAGTWQLPPLSNARAEGRLNFGIAPHPYFKAGKPVTPTNSFHIAASPYTKYPQAANQFLRYFVSPESLRDQFMDTGS